MELNSLNSYLVTYFKSLEKDVRKCGLRFSLSGNNAVTVF
jgi:hypothetical protein